MSLVAAMRSRFSRILTASAGIDPYTTAVSDVYQDLFGTGSFTGKGIYDVDTFEETAGRAFAENSILSHDHRVAATAASRRRICSHARTAAVPLRSVLADAAVGDVL